jgi:glycosyltransferase involved in cell wall biosynthesis
MNLLWFNLKVDKNDQLLAFALDWINKMAEKVDKIIILTMEKGEYSLRNNVVVYSVGKEKGYSELRRFFVFYKLLFRILKKEKIDVVFAHMITIFSFLSLPFLKMRRIPLFSWYSHFHIGFFSKIALKFSSCVLTASNEVHSAFQNKSVLTGHGVDVASIFFHEFSSLKQDINVFLTIGRISPVKDYETLIEATNLLQRENVDNFVIKIFGAPPERDIFYFKDLKKKVKKLNVENLIHFLGPVPFKELPDHLSKGDLFINMQGKGGVGKSVVEAMAAGLPVIICTDAFDIEFGKAKELLVFEERNPVDLASKIKRFLMLPDDEKKRLSALMISISRKHSLDDLIIKIFELLKNGKLKKMNR